MTSQQSFWMTILAAVCLFFPPALHAQDNSSSLAGTKSIGDMVVKTQLPANRIAEVTVENSGGTARRVHESSRRLLRPIAIFYMHGMNAAGAGDSSLLRAGICKQLGECTVTALPRIYVDSGVFAVESDPPDLTYMQDRIWKTPEAWHASAPFIDRYELSGEHNAPIVLYELNWWPLAYPLKCKWLIDRDSALTGPAKSQINLCAPAAGNVVDKEHPGRYRSYQWIDPQQAKELEHISRHATYLNRSLKNGLMDWGFGDAVMAIGPMQEILTSGIRQMMVKSLQTAGIDLQITDPQEDGPQFFFITHSLGSYLSLAAIDSDWLGPQSPVLQQFKITPEERKAADYFASHTAGFYFLANQVELLELARLSPSSSSAPAVKKDATPSGATNPASVAHWQSMRQTFLSQHSDASPGPQIIAWSDVNDLLSWDVPKIDGVHVVNCHVHNPGFKLPPLLASPISAHDNYAKNPKVLRVIFKPTPADSDCSAQ